MEGVTSPSSGAKPLEIKENMESPTPEQQLETKETVDTLPRTATDKSEQEETHLNVTTENTCAEDWRETPVSEDNHPTNTANTTNVVDFTISSNEKQPKSNNCEIASALEKLEISTKTTPPSNEDQQVSAEFNKNLVEPSSEKSDITNEAIVVLNDQAECIKTNSVEPTVEKSEISNESIILLNGDQSKCIKNLVDPSVEKSEIINETVVLFSGDRAECKKNSLVEQTVKKSENESIILLNGDQADETSEIITGTIIIPEQSEIMVGQVIPSNLDVSHDTDDGEIEIPVKTPEKAEGINMQTMNIILEESSDTVGCNASGKNHSFIKINNKSGKENYRSKNPYSKNKFVTFSDYDSEVTDLQDRLVKLEILEIETLDLTSKPYRLQKMNISATEPDVSDEENASNEDNDSIPNDDHDIAFEGDDENDDDDDHESRSDNSADSRPANETGDENDDDDHEARSDNSADSRPTNETVRIPEETARSVDPPQDEIERIPEETTRSVDPPQEEEYISRNPIAQAKPDLRYRPYSSHSSQIYADPIISGDELINNFTFSESEMRFLSSLDPNILNLETYLHEVQSTIVQEAFCNGDKVRDVDEASMTSDLGRSVVADSPQSMPSPADSFSDYESLELPDFGLLPSMKPPTSMLSTSEIIANHLTRENENLQSTFMPASNAAPEEAAAVPNSHASPNSSINYTLNVEYSTSNGTPSNKPITRLNCSRQSLQNGGTVHVQSRPSARPNVILMEKNVNVSHQQLPIRIITLPAESRSTTRVIQPRQQGPVVFDPDMHRKASERLQGKTKKEMYSPTEIEWIRLLVNKPGQTPQTKFFFIDFLKRDYDNMVEERVFAHCNYIKSALKRPEMLYMRDPVSNCTPLRLAALHQSDFPLAARCIADFIVETTNKKLDFDVDHMGETVLHRLACLGESHVKVLAELLNVKMRDRSKAFDVNKANVDGMTPLMLAVVENFKNSYLTVEQLLKHGARIEFEDVNGRNCLHYAVEKIEDNVSYEMLKTLLQSLHSSMVNGKLSKAGHYAAINKCDVNGYTPLHLAIKDDRLPIHEQIKVIQLLKQFGSDTRIKCCGHLPLLLVENGDRKEILRPHLQKTSVRDRAQAIIKN